MRPTIFALSSGAPPAAIAIVRISGPRAMAAAEHLAGRLPAPRTAALRTFADPGSDDHLDRGLVLTFPAAGSVTGEDLAELHLHGGRAVVDAVLTSLGQMEGLRAANPGEFTWRAFENGRIDLVEVEGLSDLLRAETDAQRRAALAIAEGGLSARVEDWQGRLLTLSALIEAALDFADEEDAVQTTAGARILTLANELLADFHRLLAQPPGERLRDGVRVAIGGPPNAGKSTLLNALVGREAAIVADIAGTTRDVIEIPVAIAGTAFLFLDTAGIRDDPGDAIEGIGIARATAAIAGADILLWLGDEEAPPTGVADVILVHARDDLPARAVPSATADLSISARSGKGLDQLTAMLCERAARLLPRPDELALSRRQRQAVAACAHELGALLGTDDDLIRAEHLRTCRTVLDRLTGRAGTEEMLDALFSTLCIGK